MTLVTRAGVCVGECIRLTEIFQLVTSCRHGRLQSIFFGCWIRSIACRPPPHSTSGEGIDSSSSKVKARLFLFHSSVALPSPLWVWWKQSFLSVATLSLAPTQPRLAENPFSMRGNLRRSFRLYFSVFTIFQLVSSVRPLMFAWFCGPPVKLFFSPNFFTTCSRSDKKIIWSWEVWKKKKSLSVTSRTWISLHSRSLWSSEWEQTQKWIICANKRFFASLNRESTAQTRITGSNKAKAHLLIFNRLSIFSSPPRVCYLQKPKKSEVNVLLLWIFSSFAR